MTRIPLTRRSGSQSEPSKFPRFAATAAAASSSKKNATTTSITVATTTSTSTIRRRIPRQWLMILLLISILIGYLHYSSSQAWNDQLDQMMIQALSSQQQQQKTEAEQKIDQKTEQPLSTTRTLSKTKHRKFYSTTITVSEETIRQTCWLIRNWQWMEDQNYQRYLEDHLENQDNSNSNTKNKNLFQHDMIVFVLNQTAIFTTDAMTANNASYLHKGKPYQPPTTSPFAKKNADNRQTPLAKTTMQQLGQMCGDTPQKDQTTVDLSRVHVRELSLFPWQFGPMRQYAWSIAYQRLQLFDPSIFQDDFSREEEEEEEDDITLLSLDLDLLIRKDVTELLNLRTNALLWQVHKHRRYATEPFVNAGVQVIRPNRESYQMLLRKTKQLALHDDAEFRRRILHTSEQSLLNWAFHNFTTSAFTMLGPTYNLIMPFCEFGAHPDLYDQIKIVHATTGRKFWQRRSGKGCVGKYVREWHQLHPHVTIVPYVNKVKDDKVNKKKRKKNRKQ